MLVSYVDEEGVELTVHKESVVVEEIKEVELRSRRAQFIYDKNYNRIGLQPRGHAPSRLPVKKLRTDTNNGKYFFPDNDYVRQVDHIRGY